MARAAPILDESWPRTVAEFEAWHALQPDRWEFVNGQPRAMAPASMPHSVIKNNVFRLLDRALAEQRLQRTGRRAADPDRRHLGDPGRRGDLRAARSDVAGDRGTGDHRRGDVALDRGRRSRPQVAELPQDREPQPLHHRRPAPAPGACPQPRRRPLARALREPPAASPSTTRRSRSSSTRSTPPPTSRHSLLDWRDDVGLEHRDRDPDQAGAADPYGSRCLRLVEGSGLSSCGRGA